MRYFTLLNAIMEMYPSKYTLEEAVNIVNKYTPFLNIYAEHDSIYSLAQGVVTWDELGYSCRDLFGMWIDLEGFRDRVIKHILKISPALTEDEVGKWVEEYLPFIAGVCSIGDSEQEAEDKASKVSQILHEWKRQGYTYEQLERMWNEPKASKTILVHNFNPGAYTICERVDE